MRLETWVWDDGGRPANASLGRRDCVVRAVAIAAELPYAEVAARVKLLACSERPRDGKHRSSASRGVWKQSIRRLMSELGWEWHPTMQIGSGCTVHLRSNELPSGRLVVSVSKHLVAVVDGVVHDMSDPTRDGTRCVYGYWSKP